MAIGLIAAAGGDRRDRPAGGTTRRWRKSRRCRAVARRPRPQLDNDLVRLLDSAEQIAPKAGDSFVTVERILVALALATTTAAGQGAQGRALHPAGAGGGDHRAAWRPHRRQRRAENAYEAMKKYARDLTAGGARRQARSGDRPRRGNPPHHPDPGPPHQEQPGADRRARRRQDRDRRRPGAAHRQWRRARDAAATAG